MYRYMRASNERLTVLSEAEKAALYESPDFDAQRLNYLNLTAEEQALMRGRANLADQVHCAIQIGYFKGFCRKNFIGYKRNYFGRI